MANPNIDLEYLDKEPVPTEGTVCDESPDQRKYVRTLWLQDGRKFSVLWTVTQSGNGTLGSCLGKACHQFQEHDRAECQRLAIALLKGEGIVALRYTGDWEEETMEASGKPRHGRFAHFHVSIGGVPVYVAYSWSGNVVKDAQMEIFEADTPQTIVPYGEHSYSPPTTSPEWRPWKGHLGKCDYLRVAIALIEKHFPYMFSPDKFGVFGPRPKYNCKCCPPSWRPSIWYYCGDYVTTVVSQLCSAGMLSKKKMKIPNSTKKALARRLVLFTMSCLDGQGFHHVFQSDLKTVPFCARKAINQFNWDASSK